MKTKKDHKVLIGKWMIIVVEDDVYAKAQIHETEKGDCEHLRNRIKLNPQGRNKNVTT